MAHPHEVHTSHGTVVVHGHDVTLYDSIHDWVEAHKQEIQIALQAANLAFQVGQVIVKAVRKR